MLVRSLVTAGSHKIADRKDPDQTDSAEAVGLQCLNRSALLV